MDTKRKLVLHSLSCKCIPVVVAALLVVGRLAAALDHLEHWTALGCTFHLHLLVVLLHPASGMTLRTAHLHIKHFSYFFDKFDIISGNWSLISPTSSYYLKMLLSYITYCSINVTPQKDTIQCIKTSFF